MQSIFRGGGSGKMAAMAAALLAGLSAGAAAAWAQETPIPGNDLPWLHQQPAPATPAPAPTTPAPAPVQPAPPPPPPQAAPPPPNAEIKGRVKVLDTATLIVGGQQVSLYGVTGLKRPYDQQMASYIRSQGGTVDCTPQSGGKYICRTPQGYDVGEAALFNGGARAAPDAPPYYLQEQDEARNAHRGIWGRGSKRRNGGMSALF